jgi:phthalate 3,4-dioxygenase ferredoxin reductase component
VAGVRVATALRTKGSRDEIILVGEEEVFPYDKPCLSKAELAGTQAAEGNTLLPVSVARDQSLNLRLATRAVGLDLDAAQVLTDRGPIGYDRLVLATGARARTLPWVVLPGVHVLRTQADCARLRSSMTGGGRLLIVGGGFVGCEVAATARGLGVDVVLVEPLAHLVPPGGPELGALVGAMHVEHDVDVRLGCAVRGVRLHDDGLAAELDDGTTLIAQTILVGIGAVPNVEWLEGLGLDLTDGVACDPWGRIVRDGRAQDNVFAVGDVAGWTDPVSGRIRRVGHWTSAIDQATQVARVVRSTDPDATESLADIPPHAPTSYVWSDQYGRTVHLVGNRAGASRTSTFSSPNGDGIAIVGEDVDGAFVFGAVVDWPRALLTVRKAARDGARADAVETALRGLRV